MINIRADATGRLWSCLAHRHYQLTHRAELLHDLLLVTQAIAEFHRRFPMQAPLRGTSRTWISTTIETAARHIEALLNPGSCSEDRSVGG
ncbi:hypothetical protein ACFWOJ_28760 [Streptomyces sp. NPDC058439]|uniref:hypothetical protein n=1 Tax=Streptomyces sp. NPDC058439 TaxID=3346500 RepID=UPI0036490213